MEKLADDFVLSMNNTAEKAVPEAASVFSDAIKQMTIGDAKAILTGTNKAATQYFRRVTETNLFARFYPVVTNATQQVGVTAYYKQMLAHVNGGCSGLGGLLGSTGLAKAEEPPALVLPRAQPVATPLPCSTHRSAAWGWHWAAPS